MDARKAQSLMPAYGGRRQHLMDLKSECVLWGEPDGREQGGVAAPPFPRIAQGSGFSVQGSGFRVQGSGFRVQGSGFRLRGSDVG